MLSLPTAQLCQTGSQTGLTGGNSSAVRVRMVGLKVKERKLGRKCRFSQAQSVLRFVPWGRDMGCASHWGPGIGHAAEMGLFQAVW